MTATEAAGGAKGRVEDLALFGGPPLYRRPLSTSNLVRPAIENFLGYCRISYEDHRLSNTGPVSVMLERRLAEWHETDECVVFSSGFWGLVLAIRCVALPGRREVVMPSLTYRRMADAVAWTGLIPTFCDVEEHSLAPSRRTMEPLIGDDTALILAAQPIVNCCDAPSLEELSAQSGVPLLIDSVESAYESFQGRRVGSFGRAELFSLHASKLINGMEGGYITTNDPALADRLRLMRAFGYRTQDRVEELGLNAKLNEIHAAMALAGLDEVESGVAHNREIYRLYSAQLGGLPGIRLLKFDETERCSYKIPVIELCLDWPLSRATTISLLNAEGLLARAYYHPPLHMRPRSYPTRHGSLDVTERMAERFVLLPCGYQVDAVAATATVELLKLFCEHATEIRARTGD